MEHEILIWAKNKETGSSNIVNHLKMTQDDIEDAAITKYYEDYNSHIDVEQFEYSAELDKTTH